MSNKKNNHFDLREIDQLKRDLYSYDFLKKELKVKYLDEIADLNAKLEGLYKKRQENSKGGRVSVRVYNDKKNSLITEKDKLNKEMLDSVAYKITAMIDNVMYRLTASDKDLIRDKFIYNKTFGEIAKELFISKSVVVDRTESILREMVKIKKSIE
ncbi:hypothetical protein [Holdemania massiliensis]|uniref:hypothetical protein n=1 Tax=Holdemania massiliensis TaxID=1468449 RepID=UPI00242B849C|nr:hypothetical protein [Holdemania massiliensis]